MITYKVRKGDYGYTLTFTIKDSSGAIVNLAGSVVTFKAALTTNPTSLKINSACSIPAPATGVCTYKVVASDFNAIGTYAIQLNIYYTATDKLITASSDINIEVLNVLG